MADGKSVPTLVKVIAVLYYIGAVLFVLAGIMMIAGAGATGLMAFMPFYSIFGAGLLIIGAIIFIAVGVLEFFVGRGLWQGRNWARITAIVLAVLGLISALISFSILSIIIDALIAGYLLFSKDVKAAFA
ncbi:hypothetical protein J4447_02550 [Candidatus Pacearchaeota archaeon]|nr:hypothetical protein [Candidatus Pacearchaeota archaeon]